MLNQSQHHRASLPPLSTSGLSACLWDPRWVVVPRGDFMGAEQRGLPFCPLARGKRWEKTCQSKPSTASDAPWEEAGEPAVLGCGQSPRDFVLQPPREAQGVTQQTLLPYVPGDVCPGQSDLMGPWEVMAETSVSGMRHRCWAQDKRWGDGVGRGIVVTPDACAVAALMPKQALWARMANCDGFWYHGVPKWCVLMSLSPRMTGSYVTKAWTVIMKSTTDG